MASRSQTTITKMYSHQKTQVGGTGTADDPYRWTIENVPDKTEIIFTESDYDVTGYDVTINGQATTDAEAGTVKVTIAENETAI